MAVVGQLMVLVGVNNAPLTAGLASSSAQLRGFSGAAGASLAVLRTAAVGVGVATVAGLALGINAAANFEDAFAGVRKTVDETELAAAGLTFEDLARQFRQMATEIPVSVENLAAIGEQAGALGIKATDIEEFTRTVALLGATTDLSTDAAATALGKVGTILGLTGSGFENFADILVELGNKGASTESEIIEVTKRFAAAGQAAGLSIPEILAFSSAIASAGVEPEAAGSSLSRLFGNMILGTANATKSGKAFATLTGRSFSNWSKLVKTDTVGAMQAVLKSLQGLDKFGQARALAAIGITNVRDVNAIRLLADTYDKNLVPALENAGSAQGALAIEAQKRFDTFNSRLTLLGQNFNELLITIGTPLLPIATEFVASVTGAIRSVSEWVTEGAKLGDTFGPVIQTIITRLGELWTIAQEVGVVILDFATRIWEGGLNKAIGVAADVIGSIVDGISGIATAILENEDAMNILKIIGDGIGTGFGIAADAVSDLLGFLGDLGETIRGNEELMNTLAGIGDAISQAFKDAAPMVREVRDALEEAVILAGEAADWITKLTGGEPPGAQQTGPGGTFGPLGPQGPPRGPLPGSELPWPLGPKNTPKLDLGPFKNVLGGDSGVTGPAALLLNEYATGGIVPGSGAQLAIVHGGERVTPAGQGQTMHITVQIGDEKISEWIERRLFNDASQYSSGFAPSSVGG